MKWYTGNDGPGSARSTAMARVDNSQSRCNIGAQANEDAIRQQLQAIAVYRDVLDLADRAPIRAGRSRR